MLQDIHDFNRDQWATAIQGNWKSKSRPIIKTPRLKYYMADHPLHDTPMMRFAILGDPIHDADYGHPLRPVLALAEVKQFNREHDPHGWSMPYITVHPSLQKQGVARQLFRHTLAWLKEHDPQVVLHRTANSDSGKHWQHVADTELFAARIPWTQDYRSSDSIRQGKVHMMDFDAPAARMVDALQRKSTSDVRALLQEHPAHNWGAPNDAYTHPLTVALTHLPDVVQDLVNAGASPAVDKGWIGYSLLDKPAQFEQWLQCFPEEDRGRAFVLAVGGHRRFLDTHPSWTTLPQHAKDSARALAHTSGTYTMAKLLQEEPSDFTSRWDTQAWTQLGTELDERIRRSNTQEVGLSGP